MNCFRLFRPAYVSSRFSCSITALEGGIIYLLEAAYLLKVSYSNAWLASAAQQREPSLLVRFGTHCLPSTIMRTQLEVYIVEYE